MRSDSSGARCRALSILLLAPCLCAAQGQMASSESITMDQAVQEAIDHNLGLLAERYNVSVAEARMIQAKLKPNPVFTYGQDYQDVFRRGLTVENSAGPSEWNTRIDYIIEGGRKRQQRIAVAEANRGMAESNLINSIRQLALDVQNAFIDLQNAKASLDLAEQNLKALSEITGINETRVRAGDLAKVEYMRSRLAALTFRNAVEQAKLKQRSARTRLAALLGRARVSDAFGAAGPLRQDRTALDVDTLRATAIQQRPDLEALRRDQARSQADIRLQLAQGKIDYTVSAQYHHQYGYSNGRTMGFFFSIPLPVYNRNQGEVERARREQQQIEARIHALQFSIVNEVRTAYDQYFTARSLLENIETNMLEDARVVRETTAYSYRRGEASLVEFLDAQRAFNDTMQSYNDAKAEYARSLYLIESTIGKSVTP